MHRSYPTPSNPKLDISSNHKAEILKPASLQTMCGPDLLEISSIAEFWAMHHGRADFNRDWKPIHKRVQKEILRRLEVGRTSAILDKKDAKAMEVKQIVIGYVNRRGENVKKTLYFTDERLFQWTVEEIRIHKQFIILDHGSTNHVQDRLAVTEQIESYLHDCGSI